MTERTPWRCQIFAHKAPKRAGALEVFDPAGAAALSHDVEILAEWPAGIAVERGDIKLNPAERNQLALRERTQIGHRPPLNNYFKILSPTVRTGRS